jgi:hypothetical protein
MVGEHHSTKSITLEIHFLRTGTRKKPTAEMGFFLSLSTCSYQASCRQKRPHPSPQHTIESNILHYQLTWLRETDRPPQSSYFSDCHSAFPTVILSASEESRCPTGEILRFAQDDKGDTQDDKNATSGILLLPFKLMDCIV